MNPTPPVAADPAALPPCAPDAISVRVVDGHTVEVELQDGRRGRLDLRWLMACPAFERLREPAYFSRVSIAWGALTWPEGEDVSPESVAARMVG